MNRHLALELARVTEAAALESGRWIGKGDKNAADDAATTAMRNALGKMDIYGTVVIGEGEMDEAPMLYIGEKVGTGNGSKLEIALDPLEGTTICAHGGPNSISVMAIGEAGNMLHAPDTYMLKIATGREGKGVVDIRETPTENLKRLADVKKCRVADLTAVVLDRPRHKDLIEEIRAAGARIQLIGDGDVASAIATATPNSGVDILFGIGGAPEGVIAAAALQCLGGEFQGILQPRNNEEIERARKMGITDINKVFKIDELAKGNLMFCATGVTSGNFLDGVIFKSWGCYTHSIVMRSESGTIRHIRAEHHFDKKPRY